MSLETNLIEPIWCEVDSRRWLTGSPEHWRVGYEISVKDSVLDFHVETSKLLVC